MKKQSSAGFYNKLIRKKWHNPWSCQIDLTYRCKLNCIHCYCKEGRGDKDKELNAEEWKKILDEIQKEGCINITFTGGDPFIRDDFLDIYSYAKNKGFIITIFTSGYGVSEDIINYLKQYPPFSIEITLNGITRDTYESITRIPGSFSKVINIIELLAKTKIRLILKTNCLKQNKDEIVEVKLFTERLLGKPAQKKHRFKYDPIVYPRLNGDKTPCNYRLSFEELLEVKKQDIDIWREYQNCLRSDFSKFKIDNDLLYSCDSWRQHFFINPYGRLKFCIYSDKFSADLKKTSFKDVFYRWPEQILKERFKTASKCQRCSLRHICYYCPSRAYLEKGDEEAPIPYYCELAKKMAKQMRRIV